MCGLRDGVGGGYEGENSFMCLKWVSSCWLSLQNFFFSPVEFFLVFGGWVFWPWGGGGRQITPPPPPVDKHIPDLDHCQALG